MQPGQPGYLPQLDVQHDQRDRAQFFLKLFSFYVTPNSLLALNARSEQLKYLMLSRAGICDVWTLWEKLEIANGGRPPKMMLPAQEQPSDPAELEQIALGMVPGKNLDPMTGQVVELREPTTITERLQAQAMLGLGMNESPVGRKAAGAAGPEVQEKPMPGGGRRITMSEAPKDHQKAETRR